ncbi:MAG: hypothetical protein ACRDU9_10825, partial [Acidimicrobiia bacterium]
GEADAPVLLRASLWIWLLDTAVFGVLILFTPAFLVETVAGDTIFNYWWIRWAGGFLLGVAIGTWLVIRRPQGRGIFVLTSGLAGVLAGVGLVWGALAGEYGGATWFLWLTYLSSLGVGALLLYARSMSREALG